MRATRWCLVVVTLLVAAVPGPLCAQAGADAPQGQSRSLVGADAPFLSQLGRDFERLFTSRQTLTLLGAGLAGSALAVPADAAIRSSRFNSEVYEGGALDHVFEPGKMLGSTLVQVGGTATVLAIGRAAGKPGLASLGSELVRAQLLTQALTQTLKFSAGRERPDGTNRRSFPSGHASGAFATATVLQRRYGWRVGGVAYGVAGYVAASRLNENKHYLSDVVFGASIGILAGRTVALDLGGRHFELSPMVASGGAGVRFTLVPGR